MAAVMTMPSHDLTTLPSSSPLQYDPPNVTLKDEMYGVIVLDGRSDALLIDLVRSKAVQRLRDVLQHGISAVVDMCNGARVTRYEHSIGAMLLVRRLGASLEEQAAALLHDVAHTALSHVVDSVFDGRVVHEDDKHVYVDTTDIADIIARHGYDPDRVLNEHNFTLLEREAPRLCADRVDYGLRDALAFGLISLNDVHRVLDGLIAYEGEIVCKDIETARLLSESYMSADRFAWGNPAHGLLYKFAAETIRRAFEEGQLVFTDLWRQADDEFWQALVDSPHRSVRQLTARVRPIDAIEVTADSIDTTNGEAVGIRIKTRTLDPTVLVLSTPENGRRTAALSESDDDYRRLREAYIASKTGLRYFVARSKSTC